jgi:hypothetical protein
MKCSILFSRVMRGLCVTLLLAGSVPPRGWAAGPCSSSYTDFGDAPEDIVAYPSGVVGRFPTCMKPSPAGTQEIDCGAALSTLPGVTGFVMHHELAATGNFWLGCYPGPGGLDSEPDGKLALMGIAGSGCLVGAPDCTESMGGTQTYAQDECFGDGSDAGLVALPNLVACGTSHVDLAAYSCGATLKVYLNVLIDWNQDGDWNDNIACNAAACAPEWAVKNAPYMISGGCNPIASPNFRVGPNPGQTWMRLTLSYEPVNDDFPWAGSTTMSSGYLHGGETEDYPLTILPGNGTTGCAIEYSDFGDAPEGFPAYSTGVIGHFPTCTQDSPPGTQTAVCVPAPGTPPGPTGFVRHIQTATDVDGVWFGCNAAEPPFAVDSEVDGKVGIAPGAFSRCNDVVPTDCFESITPGFSFGQDECYGDNDAGLAARVAFPACTTTTLTFNVHGCSVGPITAYLNVLVDWNQDGDWNDVDACVGACAPEWALKNAPLTVNPGCQPLTSPPILAGPFTGAAWMRTTLSLDPVPDDFPWRGSAGLTGQALRGGETEDYPVDIVPASMLSVDPAPATSGPGGLWLAGAEPCPARTTTALRFGLSRPGDVSLVIYDLVGRRVRGLIEGSLPAGPHRATWDFRDDRGTQVPNGLYFARLRAEGSVMTRTAIRSQ